jgi:hypothetical protein
MVAIALDAPEARSRRKNRADENVPRRQTYTDPNRLPWLLPVAIVGASLLYFGIVTVLAAVAALLYFTATNSLETLAK